MILSPTPSVQWHLQHLDCVFVLISYSGNMQDKNFTGYSNKSVIESVSAVAEVLSLWTSELLCRWCAADGAVRAVWWWMSSAAVWMSFLSPIHGRPAGSWLRRLLSLSFSPAPASALCSELPVGLRELSIPPWRPRPPKLLFLPTTHARRTFYFRGPWLWFNRGRGWCPT